MGLAQTPLISGSSGSTRRIWLFLPLLLNSERILLPPHLFSSIPAHVSLTSFPAGSRARFKRPCAASSTATLSILFEHSCSHSPPFRPVPRGLSARMRRQTRPFSAHSGHLLYSLFRSPTIRFAWLCSPFGHPAFVLGSNDPNTIPDPTQIRCSRSRMVSYVSARTPFLFGLSYVYVSFGLRDSPVTSLVTS